MPTDLDERERIQTARGEWARMVHGIQQEPPDRRLDQLIGREDPGYKHLGRPVVQLRWLFKDASGHLDIIDEATLPRELPVTEEAIHAAKRWIAFAEARVAKSVLVVRCLGTKDIEPGPDVAIDVERSVKLDPIRALSSAPATVANVAPRPAVGPATPAVDNIEEHPKVRALVARVQAAEEDDRRRREREERFAEMRALADTMSAPLKGLMETVQALARRLETMEARPVPTADPLASFRAGLEMAAQLRPAPPTESGSVGTVLETVRLLKDIGVPVGGPGGTGPDLTAVAVDKLIDRAPQLITAINQANGKAGGPDPLTARLRAKLERCGKSYEEIAALLNLMPDEDLRGLLDGFTGGGAPAPALVGGTP